MKWLLRGICLVLASGGSATAQQEGGDGAVDCDALYAEITADTPIDLKSCTPQYGSSTLDQCTPPAAEIARRPTSHMILAIDASGSMAGQVGGESKMAAAKREALAFLKDIPQEVKVGLVVYGHRGNNKEDGKAESCAASELVHDFGARRGKLEESIRDLSPTGWTPLGGVLEYSAGLVADLPAPKEEEGDLAPVVYLISDGEETCEGDPVAAAGALYEAGVKTVVNTIGFDVDAGTAAQLEAIAAAAGGTYYPAKDARELRRQLDAIKETEAQLARYRYCVHLNAGRVAKVYYDAYLELAKCVKRNDPTERQMAVLRAMKAAEESGAPGAACAAALNKRARDEARALRGVTGELSSEVREASRAAVAAYRAEMALE
ncbi:VWA domain-containing protein [Oceanicola sp. 502str15]|uniref:vWA domain-containing protein n=1 Tax=Oceanicola sp. 502str15 TaxID=2696061 RepID=UPI00209428F3|nr:VWA domain-containing protein [Oceanicola sp. 502str15]MCO6381613.1 VWA domain-containing protein [Oceanicola sp. 502str15]